MSKWLGRPWSATQQSGTLQHCNQPGWPRTAVQVDRRSAWRRRTRTWGMALRAHCSVCRVRTSSKSASRSATRTKSTRWRNVAAMAAGPFWMRLSEDSTAPKFLGLANFIEGACCPFLYSCHGYAAMRLWHRGHRNGTSCCTCICTVLQAAVLATLGHHGREEVYGHLRKKIYPAHQRCRLSWRSATR